MTPVKNASYHQCQHLSGAANLAESATPLWQPGLYRGAVQPPAGKIQKSISLKSESLSIFLWATGLLGSGQQF